MDTMLLALALPPLVLVPAMGLLSRVECASEFAAELRRKTLHAGLGLAAVRIEIVVHAEEPHVHRDFFAVDQVAAADQRHVEAPVEPVPRGPMKGGQRAPRFRMAGVAYNAPHLKSVQSPKHAGGPF